MLAIYRRHTSPCRYTSRRFRNCKCPIWVQGSLGGEYLRRSLDLRAWEAATDLVRSWESAGKVGQRRIVIPTITGAVEKFLIDAKARNLKESSLKKYRRLLEGELLPFCEARNAVALERLTVEFLRDFRDSLAHSPITQQKKLESLRAFLAFCHASDWLSKNPAKAVKLPKVERTQVKPFSAAEMKKLLMACDEFRGDGARLRAMILLLRTSGLRIADAMSLTRDRIKNREIVPVHQQDRHTRLVPVASGHARGTEGTAGRKVLLLVWEREAQVGAGGLAQISVGAGQEGER